MKKYFILILIVCFYSFGKTYDYEKDIKIKNEKYNYKNEDGKTVKGEYQVLYDKKTNELLIGRHTILLVPHYYKEMGFNTKMIEADFIDGYIDGEVIGYDEYKYPKYKSIVENHKAKNLKTMYHNHEGYYYETYNLDGEKIYRKNIIIDSDKEYLVEEVEFNNGKQTNIKDYYKNSDKLFKIETRIYDKKFKNYNGEIIQYNKDGSILNKASIINGELNVGDKMYNEKGLVYYEMTQLGLLYYTYFENTNIISSSMLKLAEAGKCGEKRISKKYYENGKLKSYKEIHNIHDNLQGNYKEYYENGNEKTHIKRCNGILEIEKYYNEYGVEIDYPIIEINELLRINE